MTMVGRYGWPVRRYAVLALIVGSLFLRPQPALACSCITQPKTQVAEGAAVAFTGTASGMSQFFGLGTACSPSSASRVGVTFEVETVYKGDVGKRATVFSAADGASCGATFELGKRYTVFAVRNGEALETDLCRGNADGAIVPSEYGLGAGRPPG